MASALEAFYDQVYDLLDLLGMDPDTIPRGLEDIVMSYLVDLTMDAELAEAAQKRDIDSFMRALTLKAKHNTSALYSRVVREMCDAINCMTRGELEGAIEIVAKLVDITRPLRENDGS